MNWKVMVIAALIVVGIFCHFCNKHIIINNGRELDAVRQEYQAQKVENLSLITKQSRLSSRDRIQKLASAKLDMFFPTNNDNVHTIKFDTKKKTFRLIDYIVPSAEALTR